MKTITKQLRHIFLSLFFLACFPSYGQSMATYTITFTGTWNATDHSEGGIIFPTNDHWSDLVGATHNSSITFWEAGELASLGIEDVAERGDNAEIFNEVNDAILAGNADQWLQADFDIFDALGSATLTTVTVSEDFPLLTLVSMIAPSPDWFTGVRNVSLRNGSNWENNISIDLFPYDAGTEEGTDYNTSNAATNPQGNIMSLVNVAPFNTKKVATLNINLESVLSIPTNDFKTGIKLSPNPTNDKITISNTTSESVDSIEIFDVIGKSVKKVQLKTTSNQTILNLKDLNAGIYLVRISSLQGNSSLKKLIIK